MGYSLENAVQLVDALGKSVLFANGDVFHAVGTPHVSRWNVQCVNTDDSIAI